MTITIGDYSPKHERAIIEAISKEWNFSDPGTISARDGEIRAQGEDFLSGGDTDEDFSEGVARSVWKVNDGFCDVEVTATCLEDLPTEFYSFDGEAYAEMMGKAV